MNEKTTNISLSRSAVGIALSTLVSSVIYTWVSYGLNLFFPYFFVVAAIAAAIALFLLLPLFALLVKIRKVGPFATLTATFVSVIVVFLVWNYMALSDAVSVFQGGKSLVVEGNVTSEGYFAILQDSCITALIATAGAFFFWFASLRSAAH